MLSLKSLALALHVLSAVIWIGGMFFAYVALRPAAGILEPEQRLSLWARTLSGFFPSVIVAIVILFSTGTYFIMAKHFPMNSAIHLMIGLGTVMTLIFFHVYFSPFKKLKRNVIIKDWPAGAKNLAQIRMLVGVNLLIGLSLIVLVKILNTI